MSSGEPASEEEKQQLTLEERFAQIHDGRNMRRQGGEDDAQEVQTTKIPLVHQAKLEDYPQEGHLLKIYSYINSNAEQVEEDVAPGTLHVYSPDAKVTLDAIPNTFSYLVVAPIKDVASKPEGYRDADFETQAVKDALQKYAPQYSENGPSLYHRNVETNYDADRWTPELGQENAFAGIYKKLLPNQRDAKYYIVVQAGAPKACAELKEQLVGANMTFGELVEDPRLAYVQLLARRNAKRIAAEIAFQIGVSIDHSEDAHAYRPTKFMANPSVAEPTKERDGVQQSISSVQSMLYAGRPAVGVFHFTRPTAEARTRNYVTSSPYNGITVFNMQNQPLGLAVPTNTGIKTDPSKVSSWGDNIEKRHRGILFEPAHADQKYLKELAKDVYHEVDDEFLRGKRQMGWQQERLNCMFQLVPVVVKVANVEKKRDQ